MCPRVKFSRARRRSDGMHRDRESVKWYVTGCTITLDRSFANGSVLSSLSVLHLRVRLFKRFWLTHIAKSFFSSRFSLLASSCAAIFASGLVVRHVTLSAFVKCKLCIGTMPKMTNVTANRSHLHASRTVINRNNCIRKIFLRITTAPVASR